MRHGKDITNFSAPQMLQQVKLTTWAKIWLAVVSTMWLLWTVLGLALTK